MNSKTSSGLLQYHFHILNIFLNAPQMVSKMFLADKKINLFSKQQHRSLKRVKLLLAWMLNEKSEFCRGSARELQGVRNGCLVGCVCEVPGKYFRWMVHLNDKIVKAIRVFWLCMAEVGNCHLRRQRGGAVEQSRKAYGKEKHDWG